MIRVSLLLLLMCVPTSLAAQTAVVKSGDHAGFSRLVLGFDAGGVWEFGRVEGGFEFRPAAAGIGYDLGSVFEMIKRDRIAEVEDRGGGRLFLRVDCACHGDAFDLRNGQVVLDIKDGPAPYRSSVFEKQLDALPASAGPATPRPRPRPARMSDMPAPQTDAPPGRGGLPLVVPRRTRAPEALVARLSAPQTKGAPAPVSPILDPTRAAAEPAPETPPVAETEALLIKQIARAAAQGLLDADLGDVDPPAPAAQAAPEPEKDLPDDAPPATVALEAHVAVETAVDRAATPRGSGADRPDAGSACLAPDLFTVAHWGTLSDGLGAARSRTLGEFDRTDPAGTTALVRQYIFMTFGAEAKALIRRHPADVENARLHAIMADVVDYRHSEDAAYLADQMACDGATALWAVLAQPALSPALPINRSAVTLAFAALPGHLRQHLGPALAERFLGLGDAATADAIRNATDRSAEPPGAASETLSAAIALETGDTAAALAKLDAVIAAGDSGLPDAILRRAAAAMRDGNAVPLDQVTLLESLAFERRGSAAAGPFLVAAARAHAGAARFDEAFIRVSEVETVPGVSPQDVLDLTGEILRELADKGSDTTFLRHMIGRLAEAGQQPPDDRRRLAARFLDLGLPQPAREILIADGALPEPEDRFLFARAALLDDRPDIAIGYLAGLDGAEVDRLRATALERAADHDGAARAYAAIGDVGRFQAVAWRGGLWVDLAARGDGAKQALARIMAGETGAEPGGGETPLAASSALVETSRMTRGLLRDLLGSVPVPAIGPDS